VNFFRLAVAVLPCGYSWMRGAIEHQRVMETLAGRRPSIWGQAAPLSWIAARFFAERG
jgi:hypothetical protein